MKGLIEVREVSRSFGATLALDRVSLTLQPGEVHAILGENGSGKSTLLRLLAGEDRPDSGEILVDGQQFRPSSPAEAHHYGVALIHQELALCPHLTVWENIWLGRDRGVRRKEMIEKARLTLEEMGHADIDVQALVGPLSPAKRQVVEIARALTHNASAALFDEPTTSLTAPDIEQLFVQIQRLKDRGCAVVYVTHFLEEALKIADRYTVLRDGVVAGEMNRATANIPDLVRLMVGRNVEDLYPRSPRTPGDVILNLVGLTGENNLEVRRGEVVGLFGLNGAGRTELLRALFGLDKIKSGQIRFAAHEGWQSADQRWGQGMGLVSEDRKQEGLALNLSIQENILMPRPSKNARINHAEQAQKGVKWVQEMGIKCQSPDQTIGQLSGGNQQKAAIARLLELDVDLLLLDEPTRGIDVGSKAEIYRLIDQLAGRGKSVLIAGSYLPELMGLCDRIGVMNRGSLLETWPTEDATPDRIMEAAVRS